MDRVQSPISYQFETTLNIKEEFLPYIRICVLVKSTAGDTLYSYGLTNLGDVGFYPEIDNNFTILSFKKISKESASEKYKVYFNVSLYVETDKLLEDYFYGNPVDLMIIMYYINNRGQYESRQYKI